MAQVQTKVKGFANGFCVKKTTGAADSFVVKMDVGPMIEVVLLLLSHPVLPNVHQKGLAKVGGQFGSMAITGPKFQSAIMISIMIPLR